MNYHMRFALVSKLVAVRREPTIVPINYIEIDLTKLIDNYRYIRELIDKVELEDQLNYNVLLQISDWLYECYKKISDPIMSNRILDAFEYCISHANNLRDFSVSV